MFTLEDYSTVTCVQTPFLLLRVTQIDNTKACQAHIFILVPCMETFYADLSL